MKLFCSKINSIKFICLFFAFLFLYSSIPTASAVTKSWRFSDKMNGGNYDLLTDNQSNTYMLNISDCKVDIMQITPSLQSRSSSILLNNPCTAYTASNGKLYFASPDSSAANHSTILSVYDIALHTYTSFTIPHLRIKNAFGFAVAQNGNIYLLDRDNPQVLYCYSTKDEHLSQCNFPAYILQIEISSDGGTLFAFTNTDIYLTDCRTDMQMNYAGKHTLELPLWIDQDNIAVDKEGDVIHLDNPFKAYLHTNLSAPKTNSGIAQAYFCRAVGSTIYGFQNITGEKVVLYHAGQEIDLMKSTENHLVLFNGKTGTCTMVDKGDLSYPVPTSPPTEPGSPTNPSGGGDNSSAPSPQPNLLVSSAHYTVNQTEKLITGVKTETTIAKFKENIHCGDMHVSFTDYKNMSKTTGKIGTGAAATFSYNNKVISTYHLIIYGDLTGEGNCNSRDIAALKQHLLGKEELHSHFYTAADCNRDGSVDTLDLLKMAKGKVG